MGNANAVDTAKESGIGRKIIQWRYSLSRRNKGLAEKIASLEAAVQFLMDQDRKKCREIDVLKDKMR